MSRRIAGVFPRSSNSSGREQENAHNARSSSSSRNEQKFPKSSFTSKTVLLSSQRSDNTTTATTAPETLTRLNQHSQNLANNKNFTNRMKRTVATTELKKTTTTFRRSPLNNSPLLVLLLVVLLNLFLISSGQSVSSSLSPNSLDEMLQGELNQQQGGMKKPQSKFQRQAASSAQSHQLSKSEYDKIKREVLIDAFKLKLLKLLDLDEAPSPAQVNISRDQIPEPILKEYEKLLQRQQQHNGGTKNGRPRGGSFYRRSRNMPSKSMHHNELDSTAHHHHNHHHNHHQVAAQDEENEIEEENIRFNGSIVQQLTLLPKKYSQLDGNENEGNDWCSEIYDPMSQNLKPVPTLGCLMFNLEQKEFDMYYLKSADLYIRLDADFMGQLISVIADAAAESLSDDDGDDGDDPFDSTSINIKVNGRLVKQLDITQEFARLNQHRRGGGGGGHHRGGSNDNSVFEYADIRSVIEDEIYKSGGSKISPLKVKFLFKSKLVNSLIMSGANSTASLVAKLTDLFADLDESVALHVKFGEKVSTAAAAAATQNHLRKRRQTASSASSAGGSNGGKKSGGRGQGARHYRDCADLRKIGFASSNYSCCREVITFSMDQIGWGHWILSPKIIEYKYCRGSCLAGVSPRFDNTQIVYKMFELSHSFEAAHCCNIYDYEEDIPFIYGSPPNYLTKMVSLNAKNCLCS